VVVLGLGGIGQDLVRAALGSPEVELVGVVDARSGLAGRALGELVGRPGLTLEVQGRLEQALAGQEGVVVLHAASGSLTEVAGEVLQVVKAGASVVSTCPELSFPFLRHPEVAERLEKAAQQAGVVVLGCGLAPGFVTDRLVATLGQACGPVRHALVERTVDALSGGEALARQVGAGLSEDAFFEALDTERVGLPGLVEAAALCALGLGMDCDDFEEEVAPVLAEEDLTEGPVPVRRGQVAGLAQTVVGTEEGVERVRLELTVSVAAEAPADRVVLEAEPRLELELKGGVAGNEALARVVVNAAPRVAAAEPGLLTVLELPAGR
jgi:4-hydroxy-tetrahydrodipicolinate reductase